MYSLIYRSVLTRIDAERAHHLSVAALRSLDRTPGGGALLQSLFGHGCTDPVTVLGLDFPNRLGLAAGFDKNAEAVRPLSRLGFGHIEVGTVTGQAQPGNDRPRLFRLLDNHAVLNRMGFNNAGAAQVAHNVSQARAELAAVPAVHRPIVGINIGKTKAVPVPEAVADYIVSTRALAELADYLVINVSSPNTPGLRDLQSTEALKPIVEAVQTTAAQVVSSPRSRLGHVPVLIKIAPDLADSDVEAVANLAVSLGADGLITTNTTIDRSVLHGPEARFARQEAGGISGRPLAHRAFDVLRLVKATVGSQLAVISVGGIGDATDARARLGAGADLVQVYSGMIYGGPAWVGEVVRGIARG